MYVRARFDRCRCKKSASRVNASNSTDLTVHPVTGYETRFEYWVLSVTAVTGETTSLANMRHAGERSGSRPSLALVPKGKSASLPLAWPKAGAEKGQGAASIRASLARRQVTNIHSANARLRQVKLLATVDQPGRHSSTIIAPRINQRLAEVMQTPIRTRCLMPGSTMCLCPPEPAGYLLPPSLVCRFVPS